MRMCRALFLIATLLVCAVAMCVCMRVWLCVRMVLVRSFSYWSIYCVFVAVDTLVGPHLVQFGFDDHYVRLQFDEFPVCAVLPSRKECAAAAEKDEEVDAPAAGADAGHDSGAGKCVPPYACFCVFA